MMIMTGVGELSLGAFLNRARVVVVCEMKMAGCGIGH